LFIQELFYLNLYISCIPNQQKFQIIVCGEQYSVEVQEDNIQRMITYQISTDCNYLMTDYKKTRDCGPQTEKCR